MPQLDTIIILNLIVTVHSPTWRSAHLLSYLMYTLFVAGVNSTAWKGSVSARWRNWSHPSKNTSITAFPPLTFWRRPCRSSPWRKPWFFTTATPGVPETSSESVRPRLKMWRRCFLSSRSIRTSALKKKTFRTTSTPDWKKQHFHSGWLRVFISNDVLLEEIIRNKYSTLVCVCVWCWLIRTGCSWCKILFFCSHWEMLLWYI